MIPEKKITVEDVKYVLSSHYQGTSYDPYASYGEKEQRGAFRSIGVNRTDFLSLIQMRPGMEKDCNILEWVAFASNAFNVLVPFYATIDTTPDYFSSTTREVTTDSFYWVSRMIGAMADASYKSSIFHIERYQERVMSKGHQLIGKYDALLEKESDAAKRMSLRHQANQEIADMVKKEVDPAAVTASQVELLVQETCVAEVVHTASILLGLGALWLWPGWGGVVLWLIWFLLANLPFILIQRYNRPRLMRLHALLQRREQRKGTHEHSDTDL